MINLVLPSGELPFKSFLYSGGEVELTLPDIPLHLMSKIMIQAFIRSPQDLIELVLATEIVSRLASAGDVKILTLPYIPYGRQDRVTDDSKSFSLRAIAPIINSLGYDEILTFDCHSDVSPALINRLLEIKMHELLSRFKEFSRVVDDVIIIAPDAGANKKVYEVARHFKRPFYTALKHRHSRTGEVLAVEVYGDVKDKEVMICDDICDGGQTFIQLAKALRDKGASKVYLYVTHGIFRSGTDVFKGLIDHIYTTNSFCTLKTQDNFTVMNLFGKDVFL